MAFHRNYTHQKKAREKYWVRIAKDKGKKESKR